MLGQRPLLGDQRIICGNINPAQQADVKIFAEFTRNCRHLGVFGENFRWMFIVKSVVPTHPAANLGQDIPIRPTLAWRIKDFALAADRPVGIGDGSAFLGPRSSG